MHQVTTLLHSKGIPTFVESIKPFGGLSQWVVFACLNSQADDARRIIENPEHIPAHPVDVEEFDRVAYSRNLPTILRWSLLTLVIVGSLFMLAVFLHNR